MSLVVGNKNDSPEKKVVDYSEAQKYAEQVGIDLFETSAKDNINVEEVCIIRMCICVCTRMYVCVCVCVCVCMCVYSFVVCLYQIL